MKAHIVKQMYKFVSLAAIVLLLLSVIGCNTAPKRVSGNELVLIEEECLEDLEIFCEGMDDVFVLYTIGSISSDDFTNEVNLLLEQFALVETKYEQLKKDNPVEPESHSYLSISGTEAMDNLYNSIELTLLSVFDSNGAPYSPEQVSYIYLSQKQSIATYVADYTSAVAWIKAYNDEWAEIPSSVSSGDEK